MHTIPNYANNQFMRPDGLRNIVYTIQRDQKSKQYFLVPYIRRLKTPKKIYGNLSKLSLRFWNNYALEDTSSGVLLTGNAGSGKTECANLLANLAIDAGLPVILIHNIEATVELVNFIDAMNTVALFFDEFTKVFGYGLQDKTLSMFSNNSAGKRLYILTENDIGTVSQFILNRPGRIKYNVEFTRISEDTITEYCNDFKVDQEFIEQIFDKYNSAHVFSYDHLRAIVSEHIRYPDDTIDELLEVLNLKILSNPISMRIIKIIDKQYKGEGSNEVKSKTDNISVKSFDRGNTIYISLQEGRTYNLSFTAQDVKEIKDGIYTIATNGYEVQIERFQAPGGGR